MAEDFDWRDGEETPSKYDSFEVGAAVADGKSLKDVDDQAEMGPPVGVHTFYIKNMTLSEDKETKEPQEQPKEVYINGPEGEKKTYFAYRMDVDLAWKNDTVKTVRATFTLPPGLGRDPKRADEVEWYMKGTKEDKKATSQNTGVLWRMLKHFLGHAGIPITEDGQIANFNGKLLKFWPNGAPREIVAEIEIQKNSDKKYKSVKMFSYKTSESTLLYQANPDRSVETNHVSEKSKEQSRQVDEVLADVDI